MDKNKLGIVIISAVLTACLCASFVLPCGAAVLSTDVKGFSVLSSGGFGFGHAGLMSNYGFEGTNPEIAVSKLAKPIINYGTYSAFCNGNVFLGYYAPKTGLTSEQKTQVIDTAESLKDYSDASAIAYRASGQIGNSGHSVYPVEGSLKPVIQPSNVDRLRCDGFVEYCYEYHTIRISGPDSDWNISYDYTNNQTWHNGRLDEISPKIQAYTYMDSKVGDLDADGSITNADAQIALRVAAALDVPTQYQTFVADVNGDGSITAQDGQLILKHTAGLHTGDFPKTTNIKTTYPNNSNNYGDSILNLLHSGALNWLI